MDIASIAKNNTFEIRLEHLKPLLDDPIVEVGLKAISHLANVIVHLQKFIQMLSALGILPFFMRLVALYMPR